MAYICNDCSYRGTSSGQVGQCPACGSFNLQVSRPDLEQEKGGGLRAKWRVGLLITLWTVLLIMIARKLVN